ncbi:hypothetical protein HN51_052281 [Arachis hypogaea]|uniref:Uncharacterized protein n=1 Tax=Arachis hypogaea TaxID=3818 RepID=A0A445CBB3_ARAHY|nr:uncharacterized protein LOC107605837 isoform X2 [Arachis ipaensis]XP_025666620.1 uncharacterized protein LOC112764977 isoform X2 [Arachis hypogaea]QHN93603.1 uncharacterized protein DS421_17g594080 [Arachis hypogaea]RYR48218.1 hypothetical protein Ahy_A07g034226 [Arachis hypogaea]
MKKNNFKIKEKTAMCSPTTDLLLPPQQIQGSVSTAEWTDEKHSMFLNSMEASFVHQLYDFKQTFASITRLNESHDLKTNPWIQHYGSSHKLGAPHAPIVHAEMSDQNFADEEAEEQQKENNKRDVKRLKRPLINDDAAATMRYCKT